MFGNLQKICDYAFSASQHCTFRNEINAWVFIWYPEDGHFGHAAMLIGDLSENSPYVSWWPEKSRGGISGFYKKSPAAREVTFNHATHKHEFSTSDYLSDYSSEGNCPHVIYGLKDFNTRNMLAEWENIAGRAFPSFVPLSKNCAGIVTRVLKAGLKNSPLRHKVFGILDGDAYIWTPKRVAVVCNTLRDKGFALKINIIGRNSKRTFLKTLIRLR